MSIPKSIRPALAIAVLSAAPSAVAAPADSASAPSGTAYYFSAQGDDASDCLSAAAPCRSLDRLNALPQLPGNAFLLRRGDRFAGEIFVRGSGTVGAPLSFSAYGEGAPPVVDGGIPVGGWTLAGKGPKAWTYAAEAPHEISGQPFALIGDGRLLPLARFPDSGFAPLAAVDSQSLILAGERPLPAGNPVGSTVRIRADRRILSARLVTGFDPATGRIAWDDPLPRAPAAGTGAILADAPEFLGSPWEWHALPPGSGPASDAARLRLALPPGDAPSAHRLVIANAGFGLKGSGVSHLRIEGIDFESQVSAALYLTDCDHVEVTGCRIRNAVLTGIDFRGTGLLARGNTIEGALLAGISARPDPDLGPLETAATGARILGNRIARIGLFDAMGRPGPDEDGETGLGISAWGDGDRIEGNRIDSAACDGIRFLGRETIVEGNLVRMTGLHLDEAGAIHAGPSRGPWTTEGSRIRGNLILSAPGSAAGLPEGASTMAYGILLDERTSGISVAGNYIARAGIGVGIRRGRGHAVNGNILYGNRQAPWREAGRSAGDGNPANRYESNLSWSIWPAAGGFLPAAAAGTGTAAPGQAGNAVCVEAGGGVSCDAGFGALFRGAAPAPWAASLSAFDSAAAAKEAHPQAMREGLEALLPSLPGRAEPDTGRPSIRK